MKIYGAPFSYNGVYLDGTGGTSITSQKFELWIPRVKTRLVEVAGDGIFDLNYGKGGFLVPKPFNVTFCCQGADFYELTDNVNNFWGLPPTGFYGENHVFIFRDGSGASRKMDCIMSDVDLNFDAAWWNYEKKLLVNINTQFTPVNLPYL